MCFIVVMQIASALDSRWPEVVGTISDAIDLEATARSRGALLRRRGIRSAEQLLRLALAYGPGGLSLRMAAAWAGIAEGASLSDTAVMNRVRNAADWLGEIAGALATRAAAAPLATSGPLPDRRLRITDGSVVTRPGSTGADWRLHAVYDPAAGRFTGFELTDGLGAERFGRAGMEAGEVLLGDRGYARAPDLQAVLATGADFIGRVGWARLRLLGADETPLAWEPIFDGLTPGSIAEQRVKVEHSGKGGKGRGRTLFEARLIVLSLSPEAADRAAKAVQQLNTIVLQNLTTLIAPQADREYHPINERWSREPAPLYTGNPEPAILAPRALSMMSSASASSQCGLRVHVSALASAPRSPLTGCSCGSCSPHVRTVTFASSPPTGTSGSAGFGIRGRSRPSMPSRTSRRGGRSRATGRRSRLCCPYR